MATRRARKALPSAAQILTDVKKGTIAPLYYLYGQEDFERDQTLKSLIDLIIEPAGRVFNLDIYQAEDIDISQVVSQALTFPMMASRRLVAIKNADRLPDASARELLPLIENPSETTSLIITATKPDGRKKLFTELKKKAVSIEFRPPYDNEIPAWIQQRVKILGRQITPDAAHQLQMSIGLNLRELNTELEKLFIATTEDPITRDHVAQVIDNTRGVTIFELADALGHRNLERAQTLINRLTEQGENPIGMVALLVRHFHILRRAKWATHRRLSKNELASYLKVPAFFASNYVEQARNFEEKNLWDAYHVLLNTDNRLKSSGGTHRQILSDLAYRLCRVAS